MAVQRKQVQGWPTSKVEREMVVAGGRPPCGLTWLMMKGWRRVIRRGRELTLPCIGQAIVDGPVPCIKTGLEELLVGVLLADEAFVEVAFREVVDEKFETRLELRLSEVRVEYEGIVLQT